MVASEQGDAKMVRMLVTLGADVNAVNEFRQPPTCEETKAETQV
jgi:hypothetical protein